MEKTKLKTCNSLKHEIKKVQMKIAINKVFLAGNLTRDPELRFTQKGTAICNFAIAVSKNWKSESGERMEKTAFIDMVSFARTGEVIAEHFRKGDPIIVEGELDYQTWEDRTTQAKRSKIQVNVREFHFCKEFKETDQDEAPTPKPRSAPPSIPARQPVSAGGGYGPDDDVPF